MKLITIPSNTVFVGHRFLQHDGTGWSGSPLIRYHTYLIPDSHPLKDSVAFAHGCSFKKDGDTSSSSNEDQSGSEEQVAGGSEREGKQV